MVGIVESVRARPSERRLCQPLLTAAGTLSHLPGLQLSVRLASGETGECEAPFLPGHGHDLSRLAERLEQEAEQCRALAGQVPEVAWALDVACWVAQASRHETSLASAMFQAVDPSMPVRTNSLIAGETPDELEASVEALLKAGEHTLKLKVGLWDLQREVQRVAATRRAGGQNFVLRLDANAAWSEETARRHMDAFARYTPAYIEQPVPSENVAALRRVREAAPFPVYADEAARSLRSAQQLIDQEAVDGLVLKLPMLGSVEDSCLFIEQACQAGYSIVLSSLFDRGPSLIAQMAIAAAKLPHAVHGLATAHWLEDAQGAPVAKRGVIVW